MSVSFSIYIFLECPLEGSVHGFNQDQHSLLFQLRFFLFSPHLFLFCYVTTKLSYSDRLANGQRTTHPFPFSFFLYIDHLIELDRQRIPPIAWPTPWKSMNGLIEGFLLFLLCSLSKWEQKEFGIFFCWKLIGENRDFRRMPWLVTQTRPWPGWYSCSLWGSWNFPCLVLLKYFNWRCSKKKKHCVL